MIGQVTGTEGVFEALAGRIARAPLSPRGLLGALLALVAVATALLNLDTSVAFLTPVLVHVAKNPKPIEGFTHTVSATGGMIILPEGFAQGSKFTLENPKTQQRVEVSVVRSPQMNQEGSLIPVEFLSPAPLFWNIVFPPNSN